jgi:Rrf2 family protein
LEGIYRYNMLSNRTKYAIKALIYLAKCNNELPVLIADIAEKATIPAKFLEAILLDLRRLGILESKRGKGGGYYLARPAKSIRIGEVIRAFEGQLALLPCASSQHPVLCKDCQDPNQCQLRLLMIELRIVTAKLLDQTTLEDLSTSHSTAYDQFFPTI